MPMQAIHRTAVIELSKALDLSWLCLLPLRLAASLCVSNSMYAWSWRLWWRSSWSLNFSSSAYVLSLSLSSRGRDLTS